MEWVEIAVNEDPGCIEAELTEETCIGYFMQLSIHIIHGWEKPSSMAEIGVIREREFRAAGAGRNVTRDIDDMDITPGRYRQIVTWDPANREIVSMYRFAEARQTMADFGIKGLRTNSMFDFSPDFISEYLQHGIELGRSVVNRSAHRAVAGLFAVWTGLGILARELEGLKYFFGNVTLPASISAESRDAVVYFLNTFYSSPERRQMAKAKNGLEYRFSTPPPAFCTGPHVSDKSSAREMLVEHISKRNESVPPIVLSYLGATEDMHVFDTACDSDFGDAWETALAIPVQNLNSKTKKRFFDSYERVPGGYFDNINKNAVQTRQGEY